MFMPNFSYSFQADIAVIVLYEGTMFMQALLIFSNILPDFSYTVQADIDVIVLYEELCFCRPCLYFPIFCLILFIQFSQILML